MWVDDRVLKRAEQNYTCFLWSPEDVVVVCGRSNKPEIECQLDRCQQDHVPVLKRYGGGGTVVLHPGCAIVSLGCWVDDYYNNDRFFRAINQAIIDSLTPCDAMFADLSQDGLSDIVYGHKKIAGTSLFRSRNYLLYQGSILVQNAVELFERYLQHPSKEPEYRAGRRHSEFVTDLETICPGTTVSGVIQSLSEHFYHELRQSLGGYLIEAQEEQVSHLLRKIGS